MKITLWCAAPERHRGTPHFAFSATVTRRAAAKALTGLSPACVHIPSRSDGRISPYVRGCRGDRAARPAHRDRHYPDQPPGTGQCRARAATGGTAAEDPGSARGPSRPGSSSPSLRALLAGTSSTARLNSAGTTPAPSPVAYPPPPNPWLTRHRSPSVADVHPPFLRPRPLPGRGTAVLHTPGISRPGTRLPLAAKRCSVLNSKPQPELEPPYGIEP
jgi:hypothetical protein